MAGKKLTALYRRHVKLGATMGETAGWTVPRFYRSADDEIRGILDTVGICDISHYGKVDIKGRDIDGFLGKRFASGLVVVPRTVGEVGLGTTFASGQKAVASPSPIYVCRLTREHALAVTPPFERILSVLDLPDWYVGSGFEGIHVTNLSSILSSFTLAGPSSEAVLSKLVQVDLSPGGGKSWSLPAQFCVEAGLAKVHSIIFRGSGTRRTEAAGVEGREEKQQQPIPFFDIHCGRDYSEYIWDSLIHAGKEFRIAPFGLEARDRLFGVEAGGGGGIMDKGQVMA